MWQRSSGVTVFFLALFLGALFAVAEGLLAGITVSGALTFLVVALLAGVASTTCLANGDLVGVVLAAGGVGVFLLLVAMIISFKELS